MQDNENHDPSALISYVQLLIAIASLIAPSITFFLNTNISTTATAGLVFLFLVGAGFFFRLWQKAQEAYVQNKHLPPPAIFWRILFNKLSPVKGRSVNNVVISILVIYDSLTDEQYTELHANFKLSTDEDNDLQIVPYNYSQELQENPLFSQLRKSQAVYLFWTKTISKDKDFRKTLDFWSEKETQKPVLVVDMTNEPYTLPFDRVPLKEASTGLWRLLAKSIERTTLWHQQASAYRNIWLFTLLLTAIFVAASGIFYYQKSNIRNALDKRDKSITNHSLVIARKFQNLRERIASTYKNENSNSISTANNSNATSNTNLISNARKNDSSLKNEIQIALNEYADYSYEELINRMSNSPSEGTGHISFWRLDPNGGYYQQVARSKSNNESYRTFNAQEDTIIRCAIDNNVFVFWNKNAVNGSAAGWDVSGNLIGTWKDGYASFDPRIYAKSTCQRAVIPDDDSTSGLLCLGVKSISSENNIKNGICIDVPHKNVDFLMEEGTRNYLLQAISIMHLIPNELLKFNEDYEKKK